MADWLQTFRSGIFNMLPIADHEAAVQQTVNLLQPVLCDREGNWTADYVRLRFVARSSQ